MLIILLHILIALLGVLEGGMCGCGCVYGGGWCVCVCVGVCMVEGGVGG